MNFRSLHDRVLIKRVEEKENWEGRNREAATWMREVHGAGNFGEVWWS